MVTGFGFMILGGHIYIIILLTGIQIVSFSEVVSIIDVPSRARSLRLTKSLNWFFLGSAMYFLYGESVRQKKSKLFWCLICNRLFTTLST
jgi:phosphatidate cytidylyltransferase